MNRVVSLCVMLMAAAGGFAADAKAPPQTYAQAVKLATERHQPLVVWSGVAYPINIKNAVAYNAKPYGDGFQRGVWVCAPWTGQMWQVKDDPDGASAQRAVDYINSAVPAPVALPMAPPAYQPQFQFRPLMLGGS